MSKLPKLKPEWTEKQIEKQLWMDSMKRADINLRNGVELTPVQLFEMSVLAVILKRHNLQTPDDNVDLVMSELALYDRARCNIQVAKSTDKKQGLLHLLEIANK